MSFIDKIKQNYRCASPAERDFLSQYDEVRASSLARIYQHVQDPDVAVGMISGYLTDTKIDGRGHDDDVKATLEIAAAIRRAGFGYVWLKGYWMTPEKEQVEESSILVYAGRKDSDKLKNLLVSLRDQYGQTAFAFKPTDSKTIFGIMNSGDEIPYGQFNPDRMGEVYSRLGRGRHAGRPFVFASTGWGLQTPTTHAAVKSLIKQMAGRRT